MSTLDLRPWWLKYLTLFSRLGGRWGDTISISTLESRLWNRECSTRFCYVLSWCVTLRVLHYMLYHIVIQIVMVCYVIIRLRLVLFCYIPFCSVRLCSVLLGSVLLCVVIPVGFEAQISKFRNIS
jgi:hypothetical protein